MDVRDLGEFGLIERLSRALGAPADERLVAGIGDDAAVWRSGGGFTVATTDTMVAGVHFLPGVVAWRDVGWKAMAVNVSDIAAMGATPSFALVTLCLPPGTPVGQIDELYVGLRECGDAFGVTVAGGDVVSAPVFAVTVALCGEVTVRDDGAPALLRRGGARPGDAVAVGGPLGGSAGGLRVLTEGTGRTDATERLIARHMRPRPRVDVGRAAVSAGALCGIDISDGLVRDLGHVCETSGLGADLWLSRLPLDDALVAVFPDDAPVLAATGGEDYELIVVAPEDVLGRAEAMLGAPLPIVGAMRAGDGVRVLDAAGHEMRLPTPGWEHLA
ncbi:MAG TPA: thiamine-phosphate kinase [Dehalococcoidia bacterium]|nr:thiamine-phosphate kinase [Dehalococcoidia bacterium]